MGVYDSQMRLASIRAKAAGGASLARGLANALVDQKRSQFDDRNLDLIVPIPEHWTRRLLHPHYAAETISRQIARRLFVSWSRKILRKSRRTPKQATSPTPLRRVQQKGSFAVSRSRQISGKTILLVDDILTTGSTAHAAAKTLKDAGAAHVIVAVIAVSPLRK
jgi:predicted amidophosphoribosyltransferase